MKICVTGAAGFIGMHLSERLIKDGYEVCGFDNFNDYYDVDLKEDRSDRLFQLGVEIEDQDLLHKESLNYFFERHQPDAVIHLAAYAGLRYSVEHPQVYIDNNITGTQNLIEVAEASGVSHALYASTSSVNTGHPVPWTEVNPGPALHPYAMSKIANESQFNYSNIQNTIGLRFFTVYGPWGRPDMALYGFTKNVVDGNTIDLYNHGNMTRDFTYVVDIVEGITILLSRCINNGELPLNEIYNIGRGEQVKLTEFVDHIEKNLDRKAHINYCDMHPADAKDTWADTTKLQALGYNPKTSVADGVREFITWYKNYYGVN